MNVSDGKIRTAEGTERFVVSRFLRTVVSLEWVGSFERKAALANLR